MNKSIKSESKRKLILHVGPHKTGSTFIQTTLLKNKNLLKSFNILYLDHNYPKKHIYSKALLDKNIDFFIDNMEKEYQTIILSGEEFSNKLFKNNNLKFILKLCNILNRDLIIVYFVRNQIDWINSFYCHSIRRLYTNISFEEYLYNKLNDEKFDFDSSLSKYLKNKKFELKCIPYELKVDPFNSFIKSLKLDHIPFVITNEKINSQFGIYGIFLSKIIFNICKKFEIKDFECSVANTIRSLMQKKEMDDSRFYGYTKELHEIVYNKFKNSNNAFSMKVWGKPWIEIIKYEENKKNIFYKPRNINEYFILKKILQVIFKKYKFNDKQKEYGIQIYDKICNK